MSKDKIVDGVALIAAERQRQIVVEHFWATHDDEHTHGELAMAAACYATTPERRMHLLEDGMPRQWPWDAFWKPSPQDRVRELVKAGALIAAEIDRLQRDKEQP